MSGGLDRIPTSVHAGDSACPPNKPQAYVDEDGTPYKYVVAAGPTSQSLWEAVGDGWAYVDIKPDNLRMPDPSKVDEYDL